MTFPHDQHGPMTRRWVASFLLVLGGLLDLNDSTANDAERSPPIAPILRVETPMHTALIRKPAYDAKLNRLYTASDDKTVRVWQLPKGRLVHVLRVPIAEGFEGRLYVVDLHPDGRTVAMGGWTGWDLDGQGAFYLVNAESGDMIRRVGGFPETIGTLAFAPDGQHIVVGLQGNKGLRVLRTSDYVEVARDSEYGDRILDVGFASDGRLVAASLDGYIRLYDAQFKLIGRRRTTTGQQPLSIKFSPNGQFIAVGFSDMAPPAIYTSADLNLWHAVDPSVVRNQRRLQNINWNDTGDALYATGESSDVTRSQIYRWGDGGKAKGQVISTTAQRPGGLLPLTQGRMAFITEDPSIGIIDPTNHIEFIVKSDLADTRLHGRPLAVDAEARSIEIQPRANDPTVLRLSIRDRRIERIEPSRKPLVPARTQSSLFTLTNWQHADNPSLNGVPLALDNYEVSRSFAISPDDQHLVLGTEWSLRSYDRAGQLRWRQKMTGVVWQVVVSSDSRSVVAALSDGTIRWHRADNGEAYLSAFVHPSSEDWVAWIPSGHYVSSNNGDQYIGWHFNQGRASAPLFYRAVQFERQLYRPDLIDAALAVRDAQAPLKSALARGATDVSKLLAIAPPTVRLTAVGPARASADGIAKATVRLDGRALQLPMQSVSVYVNNLPVTPRRSRAIAQNEARIVGREITVDLTEAENTVRVEISNGQALGVGEAIIDFAGPSKRIGTAGGNLYVLAVGIDKFTHLRVPGRVPGTYERVDLEFAARDADEIARHFRESGRQHFSNIFVKALSDNTAEKPDGAAIVRALDFLGDAGERDTVIVFLASHGVSDPQGNYYFVPRDVRMADWIAAETGQGRAPSMIPWTTFFDALREVAGRRILIVDTCHARNIEGKLDFHSLAKRSFSSRFSLMVAAKGDEQSQEYAKGKHGLFTYALLEALRTGPDLDADGYISLAEAFAGALPIVEKYRFPKRPQTPQLLAPAPLDRTILSRQATSQLRSR